MAKRATAKTAPQPEPAEQPAPASPGIGHNSAKPQTPEEVVAWLNDTCADLVKRGAELVAGIDRFKATYPTIPSEDIQAKATDFAGRGGALSRFLAVAENRRKLEKEPYLAGTRAVDGFFKGLCDNIEQGETLIRQRMTVFATQLENDRRETARKEAEAAKARAEEAVKQAAATMAPEHLDQAASLAHAAETAETHANARPAEHSQVRGALNPTATSSLRETWTFEVANKMALMQAIVAPSLYDPDLVERMSARLTKAGNGLAPAITKAVLLALAAEWRGEGDAATNCMAVDEVAVRRMVVSDKVRAIPGIRIFANRSV